MNSLAVAAPTVKASKTLPQRHHAVGYVLYEVGQPITSCQNADQRRGWMSANRTEAECATAGYADRAGF